MAEILSIAIFEPLPESQEAALATIRELGAALAKNGYSRDAVYRDAKSGQYILLRYWRSEEARRAALEDPELLRCWSKLAQEIRTVRVIETLDQVGA
ncbi:MAG: putative quinol monooxygenase [Terriglobales bacterium]